MKYAAKTEVSTEASKTEIERTLRRYGAEEFVSGWKAKRAMIQFSMKQRVIRFVIALPNREDFNKTETGRARRSEKEADAAFEQGCRQRWRALLLAIKAKLESAESGIEEFETAFMGQIVLPTGETVAELILPKIALAYETGSLPPMLTYGETQ